MEQRYLPEGRLLDTAANRRLLAGAEGLAAAMERGTIVEGTALRCTPAHDLVVALGPFTGVIPRLEAAAGVAEGTVREVAILSRVGRPVSFVVTGLRGAPALPRAGVSLEHFSDLDRLIDLVYQAQEKLHNAWLEKNQQ